MKIWSKLFGGAKHLPVPPPPKPPHATLSQPKITQKQLSSSADAIEPVPSATKLHGREYFNKEWNFGITIPSGWEIVFENENEDGNLWMQPLRIVGPKASRGQPFLSVLVMPAKEDGKGLQGYMDKAEEDLRGHFDNFALDTKQETSLLGFPVAWMTYSYRIDSGPRKEINATSFFGSGALLLFQFICETDLERAAADFPTFEGIIKSLHVGSAGIRHPNITIAGSTECALCHTVLSKGKSHSVMHLKLRRLVPICDSCLSGAQPRSSQPAAIAGNVPAAAGDGNSKRSIVSDEFTFDNVQELLTALEKMLLPNVERASRVDIEAFRITARIKGESVNEADLDAFKSALFRMIRAIASDFHVQQWKVKVAHRMIYMTALSSGTTSYVATFMVDENDRAYGF